MVFALSRAADEDGTVRGAALRTAMEAAVEEAAAYYHLPKATIAARVQAGLAHLDERGESDPDALWPLVQRARAASPARGPPTFGACVELVRKAADDRGGDGPRAIG